MTARALVIAPQPFFSNRGTPLSVYYRNVVLSELGVQIDLVTYGEGQDVAISNMNILRTPRFSWLGSVGIGPSWLKLFLDFFIALRVFRQLLVRRYDFLHAHEEAVFICRVLQPVFRFKLVYDMHSNLEQQLSNMGFTRSRLIKRVFRRMQESSIRAANVVITVCPALASHVATVQDDQKKHVLIENSIFDEVRLAGTPSERHPPPLHPALPPDSRTVLYAGTLESYQGIDLLLTAFGETMQGCPDAFLLIIGGTDEQVSHYRTVADRLGIAKNSLFLGNLPHGQVARYLDDAAVTVSPRTEGSNTPLKIYQQIASGTPLVATDIESHRQVLDDSVAFLAPPEPCAFAHAIVCALTCPEDAGKRAENAQRLYSKKYSRDSYTDKVRQVLAGVL